MKKKLLILFIILFLCPSFSYAEDKINIVFAIDNNYVSHNLLAIDSILKHNTSNSEFNFYILDDGITDKNKSRISKFVKKNYQNIKFIPLDMRKLIDENRRFNFPNDRITDVAMARIMIPELLKDEDRCLYLDSDILVTTDLKELYNTNLENNLFGMVLDISQLEDCKNNKVVIEYYNSGVILMDLKKCRYYKIENKLFAFLNKHKEKFTTSKLNKNNVNGPKYPYPDQDLINLVMYGNIKSLPAKWNNQTILDATLTDEYSPSIYHFIGPVKPWDFKYDKVYPYRLYYKYWFNSPFKKDFLFFLFKSFWVTYIELCKYRISSSYVTSNTQIK